MRTVRIHLLRYKNGCHPRESAPNAEKQSTVLRRANHAIHPMRGRMLARLHGYIT